MVKSLAEQSHVRLSHPLLCSLPDNNIFDLGQSDLYIVKHSYKAQKPKQLTLTKGEVVKIVQKLESGWWKGILDDGKVGRLQRVFASKLLHLKTPR